MSDNDLNIEAIVQCGKNRNRAPVLVVAGPTASGKSALALAAARAFRGTVVNADSMQVYRELPILSAAPGAGERAAAPHALYGVLSAAEPCSAGRWRDMALAAIGHAHAAGRLPVVAGGTGLYLKALMEGLVDIPPVPRAVHVASRARMEETGPEAFHRALAARDPQTAATLRPSDRQRLIRAWDVLDATGRGLAAWQADRPEPPPLRFVTLALSPPRKVLYPACDTRLDGMIAAGALGEVRRLMAMGLDPALPAMKAVGVPELMAHLRGECALDDALAAARTATRRYAKRQMTWLRHQIRPDFTLDAQFYERDQGEIFSFIRLALLTATD